METKPVQSRRYRGRCLWGGPSKKRGWWRRGPRKKRSLEMMVPPGVKSWTKGSRRDVADGRPRGDQAEAERPGGGSRPGGSGRPTTASRARPAKRRPAARRNRGKRRRSGYVAARESSSESSGSGQRSPVRALMQPKKPVEEHGHGRQQGCAGRNR